MNRRRQHRESGSSALEVAALAPIIALVAMALVQAAFAAYGITATQTAAREGARASSLNRDVGTAVDNALPSWLPATVETFGPGHGVRVHVDLPDLIPGTNLIVTREAVLP